jgi:hypothetical protein
MSEPWEPCPRPAQWPSFGSALRAARVGYRWSDAYKCFVRISAERTGGAICIEVAPDKGIPNKHAEINYKCWWDEPEILDLLPALKALGPVTKYQRIYVDDNGERVNK